MKNILLIALILISTYTLAQNVNIPDANFKNALINTLCVDADFNGSYESDADTNNDGEIQVSEAEAVLRLDVSEGDISSLEGIQSFINLEKLNCRLNELTSLDVTQISNLDLLRCNDNQLTSLDVTQNPNLKWLDCYRNELSSLDVSHNPILEGLHCSLNQLTHLDVTQNSNLIYYRCNENLLTNLDVTQNPNLLSINCGGNQLTSLDVTQNPNLKWFHCFRNQLTDLNVTENSSLETLDIHSNELTNINVSQNLNLDWFRCDENQLTNIDLSQNLILESLFCNNNPLTSLNIKNGNNQNMVSIWTYDNPTLYCINVDDVDFANGQNCDDNSWCKDDWTEYSENCNLGIEDFGSLNFNIYPNPVNEYVNIETQFTIEGIRIYNAQGILVKKTTSEKINISELTTGIYFISVTSNGKTQTKKFIKK